MNTTRLQNSTDITKRAVLQGPESFIGIGVSIGTDDFVRNFVGKACRAIIDDVEKLDAIQDGFIHYQLLRFYQTTRLKCTNSHFFLRHRCVLHQ